MMRAGLTLVAGWWNVEKLSAWVFDKSILLENHISAIWPMMIGHDPTNAAMQVAGKQPVGTMNVMCERQTFDKAGGARLTVADTEEWEERRGWRWQTRRSEERNLARGLNANEWADGQCKGMKKADGAVLWVDCMSWRRGRREKRGLRKKVRVRLEWVQREEATRRRAESGGGFEGKNQLRSLAWRTHLGFCSSDCGVSKFGLPRVILERWRRVVDGKTDG
jgi:hypothetical protein